MHLNNANNTRQKKPCKCSSKKRAKNKIYINTFGTSPKAIARKTQTIFCKEKANETFSLSVANET